MLLDHEAASDRAMRLAKGACNQAHGDGPPAMASPLSDPPNQVPAPKLVPPALRETRALLHVNSDFFGSCCSVRVIPRGRTAVDAMAAAPPRISHTSSTSLPSSGQKLQSPSLSPRQRCCMRHISPSRGRMTAPSHLPYVGKQARCARSYCREGWAYSRGDLAKLCRSLACSHVSMC